MKTLNKLILASILFLINVSLLAQTKPMPESTASGFAIGYNINQFQHDFGIGVNLTSPYFLNKRVAVRLSGNLQWLQYISSGSNETEWKLYKNYKLGLTGISGHITNSIRVYGEGGLVLIIPNKNFSEKSIIAGGYGVFGFEFFLRKKFNYFIELGGMSTGAVAEKSVSKTIYSNGFTTSVGFRKSF